MASIRNSVIVSLLILSGCTVGPDYHAPIISVPGEYGARHDVASSNQTIEQWWTAFNDPVLNDLIARARRGNLDVRQAASRVVQARAQERAARAAHGPSLSASAQGGYNKLSENSLPGSLVNIGGGNNSPTTGGGLGLPGEGFATFQTGFDASWELDLFGGQRRSSEAAKARTEAAAWSQRDAEVILAAEVANNYQQYRALQRRIEIVDATLASESELLEFVKVRSSKGLTTSLDERRQEREVAQLAAQKEDLKAQAGSHIHALGTLLGLAPTALNQELRGAPSAAPSAIEVPPGLPSELLKRRPDIRGAERRLAAANADIGVATADLYPKFSLTGALQLASRSLTTLLETDSILANGAGRISLPLLGQGASRATVQLREAQANEAFLAYQSEVLIALKDVEDALTRLSADRLRVDQLRAAENAAHDAADTTHVRYRNGLIAYLDVLEARQSWLSAQDALAQAEAANAQNVVALYKALGGGWDESRIEEKEDGSRGRHK